MYNENRVIWAEGMFLRAQHFQQTDRWTERMMYLNLQMTGGYFWGIAELEIDIGALSCAELSLLKLRILLPDGSLVETPIDAAVPAPLTLEETSTGYSVYLTLSRREAHGQTTARQESTNETKSKRVRITTREIDLPDANQDIYLTAPIEVGQYDLQLTTGQSDSFGLHSKNLVTLEVARVLEVKPDKSVLIDGDFIPPCLNCSAAPKLMSYMKELSGLIAQHADSLAERVANPAQICESESADLIKLSALNRAELYLRHLIDHAGKTHPEEFFKFCIALIGEMAVFTKSGKRPGLLPVYCHDDLDRCLPELLKILRDSLTTIVEKRIIAIPLVKKQYGFYVGPIIDPDLLNDAACVLAVQSSLPEEEIRLRLPTQIKIGPIEEITKLVKVAISGIQIQTLTTVPRQLPYKQSTTYFELNQKSPLWLDLNKSKAIALHLAAHFPDLQMELWLIKK